MKYLYLLLFGWLPDLSIQISEQHTLPNGTLVGDAKALYLVYDHMIAEALNKYNMSFEYSRGLHVCFKYSLYNYRYDLGKLIHNCEKMLNASADPMFPHQRDHRFIAKSIGRGMRAIEPYLKTLEISREHFLEGVSKVIVLMKDCCTTERLHQKIFWSALRPDGYGYAIAEKYNPIPGNFVPKNDINNFYPLFIRQLTDLVDERTASYSESLVESCVQRMIDKKPCMDPLAMSVFSNESLPWIANLEKIFIPFVNSSRELSYGRQNNYPKAVIRVLSLIRDKDYRETADKSKRNKKVWKMFYGCLPSDKMPRFLNELTAYANHWYSFMKPGTRFRQRIIEIEEEMEKTYSSTAFDMLKTNYTDLVEFITVSFSSFVFDENLGEEYEYNRLLKLFVPMLFRRGFREASEILKKKILFAAAVGETGNSFSIYKRPDDRPLDPIISQTFMDILMDRPINGTNETERVPIEKNLLMLALDGSNSTADAKNNVLDYILAENRDVDTLNKAPKYYGRIRELIHYKMESTGLDIWNTIICLDALMKFRDFKGFAEVDKKRILNKVIYPNSLFSERSIYLTIDFEVGKLAGIN